MQCHPDQNIALFNLKTCKLRVYKIKGNEIKCEVEQISLDNSTGKIHIPTRSVFESPVHKIKKINTPTKQVHKQLFVDNSKTETAAECLLQDEIGGECWHDETNIFFLNRAALHFPNIELLR